MSARFPDPHLRLGSALAKLSGGEILESRQSAWASATFVGARHHYVLSLPGGAACASLACLDEQEFDVPGHIVADIVMRDRSEEGRSCHVAIDALTVQDH